MAESLAQGRKRVLNQLNAIKVLLQSGQSLENILQVLNLPESENQSFRELLAD